MSAPHSEISIVMPVHNCASWLGESVESLLNQDFDTFELILIDDGSTDESLDMARLYAERDTRITVYSQPHLGAAAARNAGLEAACGQYMLFLDSDDLFEPTLLSRLHEEAEKSGADIVVCQADAFFEDDARNRKPLHVSRRLRPGIYRTEELEAYLFQSFSTRAWNKLIRSDLIRGNSLSFQQIPRSNDVLFVDSALALSERICVIDDSLVHYRLSAGNKSSGVHLCDLWAYDSLRKMLSSRRLLGSEQSPSKMRRSLDNACLNMVVSIMLRLMLLEHEDAASFIEEYLESYEPLWGIGRRPNYYSYYYSKIRAFAFRRLCLLSPEGIVLVCPKRGEQADSVIRKPWKKWLAFTKVVLLSCPLMPYRRGMVSNGE